MTIFNTLARRTMKDRRARSIVVFLGVFLSAMLVSGVLTFAASLQQYLVTSFAQQDGSWYAAVYGATRAQARAAAEDSRVERTAVMRTLGCAALTDCDNDYKPYLYLAAADPELTRLLGLRLTQGRMAQRAGEITLPAHLASDGGIMYHLGDRVTLQPGARVDRSGRPLYQSDGYVNGEHLRGRQTRTYRVVGIYERAAAEPYQAAGYMAFAGGDGSAVSGGSGVTVYLRTHRARETQDVVQKYFGRRAAVLLNDDLMRVLGAGDSRWYTWLRNGAVGVLLGLIALGMSALIYNAFSISVRHRARQFGMLSSVGATPGQVRGITLREGLLLSLPAILGGTAAGVGVIALALHLMGAQLKTLNGLFTGESTNTFVLCVEPRLLPAGALLTLAVALAAIAIPAAWSARVSAVGAGRAGMTEREAAPLRAHVRGDRTLRHLFGLPGLLAGRYYHRDRRRYTATIVSLLLSVVLFVTGSMMTGLLQEYIGETFGSQDDYDISYTSQLKNGRPDDGTDRITYLKMQAAEGVTASAFTEIIRGSCTVPASALTGSQRRAAGRDGLLDGGRVRLPVRILVVENKTFNDFAHAQGECKTAVFVRRSGAVGGLEHFSLQAGDLSGEQDSEGKNSLQVKPTGGRTLRLPVDRETNELPWSCSDYRQSVYVVMSTSRAFSLLGDYERLVDARKMTFRSNSPRQTWNSLRMICRASDLNENRLYDKDRLSSAYRSLMKLVQVFSYGFIILISLIAVANVFNTLSTNITQRQREIALLEAMGISRRDFRLASGIECLLFGARSLLLGIAAACAAALPLYLLFSGEVQVPFPWRGIVLSVVSVFAVIFAAMLYATRRTEHGSAAETLRSDELQ